MFGPTGVGKKLRGMFCGSEGEPGRVLGSSLAGALDVSRQTIYAIEVDKFDPILPLAFGTGRPFALRIGEIFHDEDLVKSTAS